MLPHVICSGLRAGYALIHRGCRKFAQWAAEMHAIIDGPMMGAGFTEAELDGWIAEMWEADFEVDGVSRPLSQWAAEMSRQELRAKVRLSLKEKARLQRLAEDIPVELCSRENISQTLPYLLPQQLDDVMRAETQFFDPSHADREHGFGKGYMFTNGTGTGKTYTGLGIAKRFIKQGRGRVLILTPSQQKVTDWAHDAANLGIDLRSLDDWAKQRGTTATTEKGEGAVVTTYANFRQNQALLEDEFDLIIYDESHRILENKTATQTAGAVQHYRISNKDEGWAVSRMTYANPLWQQWKRLEGEIQAEYTRLRSQARERLGDGVLDSQLVTAGHIPPPPHAAWKETDKAKWPKIHAAIEAAAAAAERFNNEELPDIREKAAASVGRTKVVFLSATPFNTLHSLAYAEGYIFSYPESNSARMSAQSQFMLEHFGAAFRFRYGQLQRRAENPEAVARQEVAFSDWLQHTLGTLSGRLIDSEYDYSRHFPTVTGSYAERFNQAMEALSRDKATHAAYQKVMTYGYKTALFESLKAAQIVDRIKAHIDEGRKIVIFHRRMETKEPLRPPFAAILSAAAAAAQKELNPAKRAESLARIAELKTEFTDMLRWEQTIDLRMPREIIADAFGADRVLFFSGKETAKAKNKAVADFNSDDSGKNIMVIQEASGKEGISLHDTTGNHQRVLITLALPESPITALQIEGRIYRIGGRSNAIFEYPLLGIDEELNTFGQKFNTAVGTTENLALGSKARNLRDSFARGVEEYSGDVDVRSQGTGGKELDGSMDSKELDPFEAAVLDYYGNRKLSGRRSEREGADFYPTPEPLGYMMTQWGRIAEGESVLEPSAGHGAIARYVPQSAALTAIEPSMKLFARLQLRAGGVGRRFESMMFEDYNTVNKHDVVVMNPPFGTAGRLAVDHVAKAFRHLEDGGRIVALIPRGSTDAKFDKWYAEQKDALMVGEVALPSITFEQAGTAVNCRVVVIDKIRSYALRERAASSAVHVDLARRFGKIEEFFEAIRDIRMPERTIDAAQQSRKKALPTARDLRQVKGVRDVRLVSDGISVDFRGGFATMKWNYRSGDNLRKWALNEFRKYAEAADMSRRSERETRAMVMEEMAALAAKLAGMSVEEAANATGVTLPEAPATPSDSDLRFRRGNKKTPVTDLPNRANEKQTSGSVLPRAIGDSSSNANVPTEASAKIEKDTRSAKQKLKKYHNNDFKLKTETFNSSIRGLSNLFNLRTKGGSRYAVLRTDGGQTVAVRLSDHAANGNNFAADNADKNISVVIERRVFDGKQSHIRYTEATIPMSAYEADPQAVVDAIVKGVEDVLADKPFTLDESIGKVEEKGGDNSASAAEEPVRFRRVVDADVLREFAEGRTVKVYRTMQIIDGRLYSPMATKVGGKSTPEIRLGVPEQSEEHPEIIKGSKVGDDGVEYGYVDIDKGLGKGTLQGVAYNPYAHCSFTVLNDQISSAYTRPNLVIVEVEVPVSELHSGYRAPMAKDAVGEMSWHSGSVSGQLSKLGRPRRVVLSRYDRPVRIVPYKEVAEKIAEQLRGTDIAIPYNVIQPQIRRELERLGVPVSEEASGSIGDEPDFGRAEYITDADIERINTRQQAAAVTSLEAMAARAREIAQELGIEVRIITDAAKVASLKGARRTAYGWYDAAAEKRGEAPVTIIIPNHDNVGDVERTMVHEIVAHYGLRRLVGKERFDAFIDEIYSHAQAAPRTAIDAIAAELQAEFIEADTRRRGGSLVARAEAVAAAQERADAFRREATEEYLAALAEKCGIEGLDALTEQEQSLWEKVIEKIRKFIERIFAGKSVAKSVKLSDADLTYILHRSLQGLRAERGTMVGAAKSAAMREAAAAERRTETAPIRARAMAASTDEFDATVAKADATHGIVMPGLRTGSVKVVEVPSHDFKGGRRAAINAAKAWVKEQVEVWKQEGKLKAVDSNGQTFEYGLDIKKMLSDKAIEKSANSGVHLAILKELPAVIDASIEAEIHPDYLKGADEKRDFENGHNKNVLMHRFYGVIENTFDGKTAAYRVKSTFKEYRNLPSKTRAYSYEAIEIEPLEAPRTSQINDSSTPLAMTYNGSMISVAKLLQGVEKSYDPGKKLLDESPDTPSDSSIRTRAMADSDSNKAARIQKLRDSKPVVITKDMIPESVDLNDRSSIKKWLLESMRGEYRNSDTGKYIIVSKKGIKEVIQHGMSDPAHVKSLFVIPQMLEQSVFIDSRKNEKNKNDFDAYEYYVCGLKIDGEDYTAKIVVGVKDGQTYYDHRLSNIEKGHLIDSLNALSNNVAEETPSNGYKGTTLESLLQVTDENIRFRRKPVYNSAREDYDASFRTKTVRDQYGNVARDSQGAPMRGSWLRNLREAYQDSMLSLLRLQETVERHSGKKLEGHENAYISENAMSSSVAHRSRQWKRNAFEPLMKIVAEFEDKIRAERVMDHANLTRYMMAKHGIERNALMRAAAVAEAQAADYSAYPDPAAAQAAAVARAAARDYAGLTGLTGQKDVAAAEAVAQTIIDDFENRHGQTKIDSLWDAVRKATSSTLRTRYEAGLLSRDTYDRVKGMYQYYIPLKGWNDNTAGDLYEYEGDYMMGSAFRSAKGRASVADDPLANIMHDGLRTIQEAERNKMKQTFLNMALNHSTDVLYVSRQWYVQQPDGTWLPANPDIPEDATADEVDQIVKDFETDMERLRAQGAATNRRRNLKLGVKVLRTQTSQHIVQVKRAGEVYNVIVNGNPRAAQAVNGMLNPDSGEMSKLEKILMAIKNYLSKAFTTWNPAFVFSNVARDAGFAGLAVFAKENAAYLKRFAANYASISAGGSMAALLWREAHGKLDLTREADRYFAEFLRGGGETGFTQINTVEKAKRDMELMIREAQGGRITARGLRKLGDGIGALNRWAESLSRFAVYMTSRQQGRSVEESVWDAKEITVNFNKKGSGEYGARWFNFAYVFFNASVQAAANAGKIAVNHPGKTAAVLGAVTSMGFVQGLICTVICSLFGADPDDYWKLAEWERRSNFIIPIGGGKFLKIPIPHELRPFHGIGEIAYSVACGREDLMDGLGKAALGFTALLPIDFTGNGGNLLVNLAPSPVQPVAQVIANVNYFGKPIYRTDPYNSRNPYDENDCVWAQAYQADSPLSVSLSKSIARLFAGEPDEFGVVEYSREAYADIPPGVIDHLLAGYTGGWGKFVMGLGNCAAMAFGDEEFDIKKIPVVSSFVTEADDRAEERADRARYRQLKSEYDDLRQYHRRLVTMPAETVEARAERVSKWLETERGQRFLDMQPFMKQINSVRARRSRLPDDPEDPHVYDRLDSLESDARQRLLSKFDSIDHRK